MTYPKELRENTLLGDKNYPFNFFRNRAPDARQDQNILYLHWHEHLEWIVMLRGRAMFHIDSRPVEAEPKDVLFVPPGGLHVGYSLCDEPTEYVSVVFNASLFGDMASDPLHNQYIAPFLTGTAKWPLKLDRLQPLHGRFLSHLMQAIDHFEQGGPAGKLIVKSQLYLLTALMCKEFYPKTGAKKLYDQNSPGLDRFKQLIRYVETHYAEKITVEQAAKLVNLNPYHFCKSFKKLTGRTFIEHVNLCRMNEAERLLKETDWNVTEIAGHVGCGNPNYFTKMFKQYKGMTPSQARKEINRL